MSDATLDFELGEMADTIRETTQRFASDKIAPIVAERVSSAVVTGLEHLVKYRDQPDYVSSDTLSIARKLAELADPAVLRRETRQLRRGVDLQPVEVPFFDLHGEKVWGATAMILAEFLAVVEAGGLLRSL